MDHSDENPRISGHPVLDWVQAEHCVAKIGEIIARNQGDRRSILQLGYNLGRLSELTGLGREAFWDRWKTPVEFWDLEEMERLVQELHTLIRASSSNKADPP
jgi:hypothetical protein